MTRQAHGITATQSVALSMLLFAACGGDDTTPTGGSGGSAGAVADSSVDQSTTETGAMPEAADATDARDTGHVECPSLPQGDAEAGALDRAPATLEETGLYCDIAAKIVSSKVRSFRPRFELWSDGAEKSRWIQLPAGSKIDVSNPDHWEFPVGTRFWKEFKYLGKRVETRLIVRYGTGIDQFLYTAYKWNATETAATRVGSPTSSPGDLDVAPIEVGAEPLMHDIPSSADCANCHGRIKERILGFGAVQLSHDLGGETIDTLLRANLLVGADGGAPDVPSGGYRVPGDELDQNALGYLHANCGNCHTDTPSGVTYPVYRVRLLTTDTTVASTLAYQTAVNKVHTMPTPPPSDAGIGVYRIEGHNAEASELYFRTGTRSPVFQMPPVGTKIIHPEGRAVLKQWIDRLPPPSDAGTTDSGATDSGATDSRAADGGATDGGDAVAD
ncbi:MAG TPA: hypothetical protein VJT73_11755 [Polyangiaceae bacterium]|nr:hypothetical protein [Polyangiaceae bacterium]